MLLGTIMLIGTIEILNVSFDATRALYREMNAAFVRRFRERTGQQVRIYQSHGSSSRQARAVIEGLEADVLTLALGQDIDAVARQTGLIPSDWERRLPEGSAPYTSTIVFVVRKGNPKHIADFGDLVRPGVVVITPSPKTSGGARWSYLAAWDFARRRFGGEEGARAFIKRLYEQVPVLDGSARAASLTFAERGMGDVLITWESEARLLLSRRGDRFELIVPARSILCEPKVALVERVAKSHGALDVARAYLEFLYSSEGQEIVARHHFRPRVQRLADRFPGIERFTVGEAFGGWESAQRAHFDEGGTFDQISEWRR